MADAVVLVPVEELAVDLDLKAAGAEVFDQQRDVVDRRLLAGIESQGERGGVVRFAAGHMITAFLEFIGSSAESLAVDLEPGCFQP